jgi:hypothetical protein
MSSTNASWSLSVSSRSNSGQQQKTRQRELTGFDCADTRLVFMVSAVALVATCLCARADTFADLWLTRIKPPPYGGVATEFDDTLAADGKRLHPHRDLICAHMLEQFGQRLRVTNVANGKSVVCRVADKGPNRRFWPRREIDLTPPASKAIGCNGMCEVSLERVAQ